MSSLLPAMRGAFGSTEFFVVTMKAKELSERLTIPKDIEGWGELGIEERYQRDINYTRVKKHIAPYLAGDKDRFFGAFIVEVQNDENLKFEPITHIVKDLLALYKDTADSIGMLILSGNEILIPLDGQHRVTAIKFAISGKDERSKDIEGLTANPDVANDTCTVIMIRTSGKKARKIFNKVNRYAKATTKSDNLITADDDIVAVISREEIVKKIIGDRLVNYKSNTLTSKAHYFTTLGIIYDATTYILEDEFSCKIDKTIFPSDKETLFRKSAFKFWEEFMKIKIFSNAISNKGDEGDKRRQEIRENYTLGKPIVQLALVAACIRLRQEDKITGERSPKWEELRERIDSVDWEQKNQLWQGVLMNGEKVIVGKSSAKFASEFIAYYLGEKLEVKKIQLLKNKYNEQPGNQDKEFPKPNVNNE